MHWNTGIGRYARTRTPVTGNPGNLQLYVCTRTIRSQTRYATQTNPTNDSWKLLLVAHPRSTAITSLDTKYKRHGSQTFYFIRSLRIRHAPTYSHFHIIGHFRPVILFCDRWALANVLSIIFFFFFRKDFLK